MLAVSSSSNSSMKGLRLGGYLLSIARRKMLEFYNYSAFSNC